MGIVLFMAPDFSAKVLARTAGVVSSLITAQETEASFEMLMRPRLQKTHLSDQTPAIILSNERERNTEILQGIFKKTLPVVSGIHQSYSRVTNICPLYPAGIPILILHPPITHDPPP